MKTNFAKVISWTAGLCFTGIAVMAQNQNNLGADCGCPPVNTRPTIDLATLATSGDLNATNTVLTCNNNYLLTQKIYVPDGKTLTINPGTVILGADLNAPGAGVASSLIVARGGKIIASGTPTCQIVFTAQADLTDNILGNLPISNRGRWGGVAICGKATNNLVSTQGGLAIAGQPNGTGAIEGISNGGADQRTWFGGNDDNDNSGIFRYVSIRHAGDIISAGNELNSLTLASVGRGTIIDHIEVVSGDDDGIELFGGTVNLKYCSVLFGNDDMIDYDLNWRGNAQFIFGLAIDSVTATLADQAIEADGDDNNTNATPRSHPVFYNCTFIGNRAKTLNADNTSKAGLGFKERTEGEVYNSIIANFYNGLFMDQVKSSRPGGPNNEAYHNWQTGFPTSGTLLVNCNSFINCTNPLAIGGNANGTYVTPTAADNSKFGSDGNTTAASLPGFDFQYTMNTATNAVTDKYDATPEPAVATTCNPPSNGFFTAAPYRGAFEAGKKSWLSEWTIQNIIAVTNGIVPCPTDINTDGVTNNQDFLLLLGEFNQACD
jgi:hypothetical protein